jgi:hypothetical protein
MSDQHPNSPRTSTPKNIPVPNQVPDKSNDNRLIGEDSDEAEREQERQLESGEENPT